MKCTYCDEDIYPGEKYYETLDGDDIHEDCLYSYMMDNLKDLGFTKQEARYEQYGAL